jgi:hypothetical protein
MEMEKVEKECECELESLFERLDVLYTHANSESDLQKLDVVDGAQTSLHTSSSMPEMKSESTPFDIVAFLNCLTDTLCNNSNVDVCICERETVCKCYNTKYEFDCECDSDIFYTAQKVKCDIMSNNMFFIDIQTKEDKIVLNKNKNVRIFTLDRTSNCETPIIDIVKTFVKAEVEGVKDLKDIKTKKQGKKKTSGKLTLLSTDVVIHGHGIHGIHDDIVIPWFDSFQVRDSCIGIQFNYMHFQGV